METGTKISASAHVVLLGAMVIGNPFRSEPLPMNVQEVSVITAEQFAALQAVQPSPEAATEVALPQVEPPEDSLPDLPRSDAAPDAEQPEPVTAAPEPEDTPDVPAPVPDTDVTDEAPVLPAPQEEVAALTPDTAEEAVPQQSDRVAPEPVAQPDPEAAPGEVEQDAVTEDATGDTAQEPQEQTAPDEATTEIVTEADEPAAAAPTRSLRPPATRPTRPAPQTATTQTEDSSVADAVAAAVAEAQTDPAPSPARSGPPLTGSEREGLRVSVSSCWNVGALSSEAQETKVTVYVAMNRDGTPKVDSIRFVDFEGGSRSSAAKVYRTARSAIVRCGRNGFPLPVEKFDQWQEIEMTFNPEGMFWR